jgi:hypothetical protein
LPAIFRGQLKKVALSPCFFILAWGLPFLTYAVHAQEVGQIPSLNERFIELTRKKTPSPERKSYGIRCLAQGGMGRLPGIDATSALGFSGVDSVVLAPVLGVEFAYSKYQWGASVILDVAPAGVPFSGSASVTSQFSVGLGVHHLGRWFQRPTRWNFVFYPYTSHYSRYSGATLNSTGLGFGVEAHIEGGRWKSAPFDWIVALNWNRMMGVYYSTDAGTQASSSQMLLGDQGGATQLIYALAGIEMNFSL